MNGYPVASFEDVAVTLDVQMMSDKAIIEAGGSRGDMMLKSFGTFPIRISNQNECVRSDQLLYNGRWYECITSRLSQNTILKHWTSTFKLLPAEAEENYGTERS